jgi:hypothetical protein
MEGKSQDFVITWFVQEKVLLYQTHPQQSWDIPKVHFIHEHCRSSAKRYARQNHHLIGYFRCSSLWRCQFKAASLILFPFPLSGDILISDTQDIAYLLLHSTIHEVVLMNGEWMNSLEQQAIWYSFRL